MRATGFFSSLASHNAFDARIKKRPKRNKMHHENCIPRFLHICTNQIFDNQYEITIEQMQLVQR